MINSILFDFFGTIVSFKHGRQSKSFINAFNFLSKQNIQLNYVDFVQLWGKSFKYFEVLHQSDLIEFSLNEVLEHFLAKIKAEPLNNEVKNQFIDIYVNEWALHIQPFDGVKPFLDELSKHYKLGILSNTHKSGLVEVLLEKYALTHYFHSITTSVDFGKAKPHHDIYHYALAKMDSTAENTLFIGDTYIHDYLTPKALGLRSILIGHDEHCPVKEHNIDCITDLNQAIIDLCQ